MNTNKVTPIVQGAILSAVYGVLGIINAYTGSFFDVLLAYVMVLPMSWYASEYSLKYSLSVLLTSAVVLFIGGQIFFSFFSVPTLLMGIYYGESLKRNWKPKKVFVGLLSISAIKNFFVFYVFGALLDISIVEEGMEMYREVTGVLPILNNILSPSIFLVCLCAIVFFSEAYVVMAYSQLFLKRIMKKK